MEDSWCQNWFRYTSLEAEEMLGGRRNTALFKDKLFKRTDLPSFCIAVESTLKNQVIQLVHKRRFSNLIFFSLSKIFTLRITFDQMLNTLLSSCYKSSEAHYLCFKRQFKNNYY